MLFLSLISNPLISLSDGLVIVGVHSAKFPNEKVRDFHYFIIHFFELAGLLELLSAYSELQGVMMGEHINAQL